MKKTLSIIVVLCFALTIKSQFSIAPTIGMSFSDGTGVHSGTSSGYWGLNSLVFGVTGGIVVNANISELISIQTEFLITQKGRKTANVFPFFPGGVSNFKPGKYTVTLNYFEIPLLAKITFGNEYKYFFSLGPYFGYAINGKYMYDPGYNSSFQSKTTGKINFEELTKESWEKGQPHDPHYHNQMDLGLYIGTGIIKKIGPGKLELDLRFGFGFIDFYKTKNFDYLPDDYKPFYNRNLNISFAYYLPLGKN